MASELESKIDALYQAPLDSFTADRNQLAAALKKSGDKAGAERVKGLAKPSTTAWAVNQVWWKHRARFEALLEAGAAQRKAHLAFSQGRTADVRQAAENRRRAVAAVSDAALEALGGHRAVTPDVQYRIAGTVEAIASSGFPEGEDAGRLTRDLQSSGLDALTALADAAARPRPTLVARGTPAKAPAAPSPSTNRSRLSEKPPSKPADRSTAAGETARERKAREAADAAARAGAAGRAAARDKVEALIKAFDAAATASQQAEAAESRARDALDKATAERAALEERLDEARAAEATARRELSRSTTEASRAELDRARAERDLDRARDALSRLDDA